MSRVSGDDLYGLLFFLGGSIGDIGVIGIIGVIGSIGDFGVIGSYWGYWSYWGRGENFEGDGSVDILSRLF